MTTKRSTCLPTCPGCSNCESGATLCGRGLPTCKGVAPGAVCECELLYFTAINGELLASNERIRTLYRSLAAHYLRSCERHCWTEHWN